VVLRLQVSPNARELFTLRLAYDSPRASTRQVRRLPFELPSVPSARLGEFLANAEVLELVALLEVARLRQRAADLLRTGNRAGAREALLVVQKRLASMLETREVVMERAKARELLQLMEEGEYARVMKKSLDYNSKRRRSG
jgi:hypothetical protein